MVAELDHAEAIFFFWAGRGPYQSASEYVSYFDSDSTS